MLVSFIAENWKSYRSRAELSLIASRERRHSNIVAKLPKHNLRLLPAAVIYGGNASGKSNLVQAMAFVQSLVVNGVRLGNSIPVEPYLLDNSFAEAPTFFSITLVACNTMYEFSFSATAKRIIEEKLILITKKRERTLYHRQLSSMIIVDSNLPNKERLDTVFEGTQDNQLFLTNSVFQKVNDFKPVYDWFANTLRIIFPNSQFQTFELLFDSNNPFYQQYERVLSELDTGIVKLGAEIVPFDTISFSSHDGRPVSLELSNGASLRVINPRNNERYIVSKNNDRIEIKKLVSFHNASNNNNCCFDIRQESDGTQRILDIIPCFINMSMTNDKVFVIDELDRSLHSLLTRKLIEGYLRSCDHSKRTQLIFTTHDLLLMDRELLRLDEMWLTDRAPSGATSLISIYEFGDVDNIKNLRSIYLQGRLGGIPDIILDSFTSKQNPSEGLSDINEC